MMPRTRYMKMNKYLHFNDSATAVPRGEDGHDKLHQIRPLFTRLQIHFPPATSQIEKMQLTRVS